MNLKTLDKFTNLCLKLVLIFLKLYPRFYKVLTLEKNVVHDYPFYYYFTQRKQNNI